MMDTTTRLGEAWIRTIWYLRKKKLNLTMLTEIWWLGNWKVDVPLTCEVDNLNGSGQASHLWASPMSVKQYDERIEENFAEAAALKDCS